MPQGIAPTAGLRPADTVGLLLAPAFATLLVAASLLADVDPWVAALLLAGVLGVWSTLMRRGPAIFLAGVATLVHAGFVVDDAGELRLESGTLLVALLFLGVVLACTRRRPGPPLAAPAPQHPEVLEPWHGAVETPRRGSAGQALTSCARLTRGRTSSR